MAAHKVILLVEDNKDDEILTLRALRKNNAATEVVVARTGEEALSLLFEGAGENGKWPDLVLLDLNLPKLDGLGVLRRIRADDKTRLLPVVILTSSREDQDVTGSYSLRANAYVRKPVDFTQFTESVTALALFWLVMNEAARSPG